MISVSADRHDGMEFAVGFAVNAAATWLASVLIIGLGTIAIYQDWESLQARLSG